MADPHTTVESIAARYLKWWKIKGGDQIHGPCPFHKEKTVGAFYMNRYTGMFMCHSCHEHGSLATFLKRLGAGRRAIDRAMALSADDRPKKNKRDKVHQQVFLNEALLGVFEYCPKALLQAGFSKQILKEYEIGFDRDAYRIIFPLRNLEGRLVAVIGRSVDDDSCRYLAYAGKELLRFNPEYRGYVIEKRHYLWNLDRVYPRAYYGELGEVIIVEGYKAALWLIQHGFDNVIALQGSYLSNEQKALLQRLNVMYYVFLDNTAYAREAALKIVKMLGKSHDMRIVPYPRNSEEETQPDWLEEETLATSIANNMTLRRWKQWQMAA